MHIFLFRSLASASGNRAILTSPFHFEVLNAITLFSHSKYLWCVGGIKEGVLNAYGGGIRLSILALLGAIEAIKRGMSLGNALPYAPVLALGFATDQ